MTDTPQTIPDERALEGRALDLVVAEHVLGLTPRVIRPSWYYHDVTLFYEPGNPLIAYSWDENACNAMMHRNGRDGTDGTAPSLPHFSDELPDAWQVVEATEARSDWRLSLWHEWNGKWFACFGSGFSRNPHLDRSGTTPAEAICRAALAAVRGARA